MMHRTLSVMALILLAVACGKENRSRRVNTGPVEPPPPPSGRPATLLLFGGGFCKTCKSTFPEINTRLAGLPEHLRKALTLRLFYVAGDPSGVHPTDALAKEYRDHYLPLAEAYADPWRWTTFRKTLPGKPLMAPWAVVLDAEEKMLKAFPPGETTFVPSDIVDFVASVLKPN